MTIGLKRHTSDQMTVDHLALAIIRDKAGVLLCQQQTPADPRPYWVMPGGLVESGELVTEALAREVREEAGVQVLRIGRLACLSQIDRPELRTQTLALIFEVAEWRGAVQSADPDGEVLRAEFVPFAEAIGRLQRNGGWPGIQTPLLACLHGELLGAAWFYRETAGVQELVACLRP